MTSTTKTLLWVLVIVVVLGAVWYFYGGSLYQPAPDTSAGIPQINGSASILSGGDKTTDIEKDLNVQIDGNLEADLNQLNQSVSSF